MLLIQDAPEITAAPGARDRGDRILAAWGVTGPRSVHSKLAVLLLSFCCLQSGPSSFGFGQNYMMPRGNMHKGRDIMSTSKPTCNNSA